MNKYNPNIHHRRSIRLKGYDYSRAGLYFITICCQDRASRFGQVVNGEMVLNEFGQIAYNEWMKLSERFPNLVLDVFQIMPNHMHGIIALVRATLAVAQNTPTDIIVGAGFTPAPNDISVQTNSVVPNSGQMNSGQTNNRAMDSGQAHDGEMNFEKTNSIVYNSATARVAQNTPTDIIVGAGFTPAPNDISVQTNSVVPNSGQTDSGEMDSGQAHDGEPNFEKINSIVYNSATTRVAQNTPTDIIVAGFTPAPNDISVQMNSVVPNSGQTDSGQTDSGEMDSGQADDWEQNSRQVHDGEQNFEKTNSIVYNSATARVAQNTPTDIIVGAGFTPAPKDISVQTDSVVPNSGQTNSGQAYEGQMNDEEPNFEKTNSLVYNSATARVAQNTPTDIIVGAGFTPAPNDISVQTDSGQPNLGQTNSGQVNSGQVNSGQTNSGEMDSGQAHDGEQNFEKTNSIVYNSATARVNQNTPTDIIVGAGFTPAPNDISVQTDSVVPNSGQMNSGQTNSGEMNSRQTHDGEPYSRQANDDEPYFEKTNLGHPSSGQPRDEESNFQQTNSGQPRGLPQRDNPVVDNRATARVALTVGDIVGAYKSLVANECLDIYKARNKRMGKLWQRNYHEHIIRNEQSYQRISEYIINNPAKWAEDKFYEK